jgi:hypothetical protein
MVNLALPNNNSPDMNGSGRNGGVALRLNSNGMIHQNRTA